MRPLVPFLAAIRGSSCRGSANTWKNASAMPGMARIQKRSRCSSPKRGMTVSEPTKEPMDPPKLKTDMNRPLFVEDSWLVLAAPCG